MAGLRLEPAENALDRLSGMGEPLRRFAIGGFERPRPVDRGVEFDREPRAVVLHQRVFFLLGRARFVVTHAPVGRQLERVDR